MNAPGNPYHQSETRIAWGDYRTPMFSPNGVYLLAVAPDATTIWRTGTASFASSFESESRAIWTQFHPDSRHIITGSNRHELSIREVPSLRQVRLVPLRTGNNSSGAVQYAADQGFIVLGTLSSDMIFRLWDTNTWCLQQQYAVPFQSTKFSMLRVTTTTATASLRSVHIAAMLNYVWGVCIIRILPTSVQHQRLNIPDDQHPECVAFSPDGGHLVVGTDRGKVLVYTTKSGLTIRSWIGAESPYRGLSFTSDGAILLAHTSLQIQSWRIGNVIERKVTKSKRVWSFRRWYSKLFGSVSRIPEKTEIPCGDYNIWDVACMESGDQFAVSDGSGVRLIVGERPTATSEDVLNVLLRSLGQVHLTESGTHIFGFDKGNFVLQNLSTGSRFSFQNPHSIKLCTSSPDSNYIVYTSGSENIDDVVLLHRIGSDQNPHCFTIYIPTKHPHPPPARARVGAIGFSEDCTMVLAVGTTVDMGRQVDIWHVHSRTLLHRLDPSRFWGNRLDPYRELHRSSATNAQPEPPNHLSSHMWRMQGLFTEFFDSTYINLGGGTYVVYFDREAVVRSFGAPCDAELIRATSETGTFTQCITKQAVTTYSNYEVNSSAMPDHYHIIDQWIVTCRGRGSERLAWLPRDWAQEGALTIHNGRMRLQFRGGTIYLSFTEQLV